MKVPIGRLAALMLLSLLAAAFAASPASAGTQVVTGDDTHCSYNERGSQSDEARFCETTRAYIEYARGDAPDPDRGLLLIDCNDEDAGFLRGAYEGDPPEYDRWCPEDGNERGEQAEPEFTTAEYSAIVVTESLADELQHRKADFEAFFDQGGGIATFNSADGTSDRGGDEPHLDFLPLPVVVGDEEDSPYHVTEVGEEKLGITDEQVNAECCMHESYDEPSDGSPLKVAVRGSQDEPEQNARDGASVRGDEAGVPGRAIVLIGRSSGDDDDDRGSNPEDNYYPEQPVQEQSQQLPDPLSFVSLFGNQRSTTVNANGGFMVPGMLETCGVGPCNVYERGFVPKPGAQASSHNNYKRHGILGRDRDVLAAGQSNPVRFRLNKLGRRKLAKAGRLRIETMVTVTDAKGRSQLVRKTITLRPKR